MNERVRLLAEQAEHNTRKEHNNAYWRLQNEIAEDETFLKKFAELLVQECIIEIGYKSAELLDTDFYPHYQERLKKRFGIKE